MSEEILKAVIEHALLGERLTIRAIQAIFAVGIALIIYSSIVRPILLACTKILLIFPFILFIVILIILIIIFMLTSVRFENLINKFLLETFITDNFENIYKFFEEILFKNRNFIDDIRHYISNNKEDSIKSNHRTKLDLKALRLMWLVVPSLSLFLIYIFVVFFILFILENQSNFSYIPYVGGILIIFSIISIIIEKRKLIQTSEGKSNINESLVYIIDKFMEMYIYSGIKHNKIEEMIISTLIALLPTFKIDVVKPTYSLRFYACECRQTKNNRSYCSLDYLINNLLTIYSKNDIYLKVISDSNNSMISICDNQHIVEDVNTLTMTPHRFLDIITGKEINTTPRRKPIILELVRKEKNGTETTLMRIFMIAWHGCLIKRKIKHDEIQLRPMRVVVASVLMVGAIEYVTYFENLFALHARQVSEESIMC